MDEDAKLKLEDTARLAVYAKNLQINCSGFSLRQLMYGYQGVVPGITEENPASMEPEIESYRGVFKETKCRRGVQND